MADIIEVKASTTYQTEKIVYALLDGGFKAQRAEIRYNKLKGLYGLEELEEYPLTITGMLDRMPTVLKVYCVTAGYGGTGPNTMVDILKHAGFYFDQNDILTERYCNPDGSINLTYTM